MTAVWTQNASGRYSDKPLTLAWFQRAAALSDASQESAVSARSDRIEQGRAVTEAWQALANGFRAANLSPWGDAYGYRSLFREAYGIAHLNPQRTVVVDTTSPGWIVADAVSVYDGNHTGPIIRDPSRTKTWVRISLSDDAVPITNCFSWGDGGDCSLDTYWRGEGLSPTVNGCSGQYWTCTAWTDPPFQDWHLSPALILSFRLANRIARSVLDRGVDEMLSSAGSSRMLSSASPPAYDVADPPGWTRPVAPAPRPDPVSMFQPPLYVLPTLPPDSSAPPPMQPTLGAPPVWLPPPPPPMQPTLGAPPVWQPQPSAQSAGDASGNGWLWFAGAVGVAGLGYWYLNKPERH